jgi:lipoate synthase
MEYANKSKEELVEEIFNLKDTIQNMSLDYNKTLQILKEVKELCILIKTKKGIFKVFAIADTAMDIVKILEKK